jgi:hypothetical protein
MILQELLFTKSKHREKLRLAALGIAAFLFRSRNALFANRRECVLQSLKLIPLIKFAHQRWNLHSLQETKQLFKSGTRRKLPVGARENKFACASFSLVCGQKRRRECVAGGIRACQNKLRCRNFPIPHLRDVFALFVCALSVPVPVASHLSSLVCADCRSMQIAAGRLHCERKSIVKVNKKSLQQPGLHHRTALVSHL